MLGPPACTLVELGAKYSPLLVHHYEVFRLLTPVILHAGLIHIALNLFAQLTIGVPMEWQFGTAVVAAVYVVGGFGGALLSSAAGLSSVGVGASGAILALVGL